MIRRQKSQILVGENDTLIAMCIKRYLKQFGYEISAMVATGEEAVLQTRENQPDLILLDITLNGKINSIEAGKKIHLFSNTPIIYIINQSGIKQWQESQITGLFGYIIKPIERRELELVLAATFYKLYKEKEFLAISSSYHSYLENLGGVILRSDLDFNPLFVHGPVEQMIGYKADEIMKGRPRLEELVHPEERPLYSSEDREKLKVLPNFEMTREYRIMTRDNQIRWVRESIKNVLNQNGTPEMIEWVIRDITDYKNIIGKLEESKKMASIGQLAAAVAHEINNPIDFVSNNMELLRKHLTEYIKIFRISDILKDIIEQENMGKAKLILKEMKQIEQDIKLDYIINDVDKLLDHTRMSIEQIKKLVMDLRVFARGD